MKTPHKHTLTLLLLTAALFATACKTAPGLNPFEIADQSRSRTDLLDAPVNPSRPSTNRHAHADDATTIIPAANTTMSRTIDAEPNDWDLSRARTFKSKSDIESGPEFWTDPNDASFRLVLHADDSYLYFLIDVIDDHVITASPQQPIDAVQIWLRDPQLESLQSSLPDGFQHHTPLIHDTQLVITPDGKSLSPHITTAALPRANGYSLEIAIPIEALPQVSTFPLTEIAFRVELLDGDDPNRPGPQTTLSMLPDTGTGTPRFALFNTELLPHLPITNAAHSQNTLGAWHQHNDGWQFQPIEAISTGWRLLEDLQTAQAAIAPSDILPQSCREARNDILLLEAYQSPNAQNRVALLLCGPNPTTGQCTPNSRTELVWTHLQPQADTWTVRRALQVFETPLTQCGLQPAANQPHTQHFSMTPLSALSPSVWAVGWKQTTRKPQELITLTGITLLDAQSNARIAELHPERTAATRNLRSLRNSQIFFTHVDDKPGLDICEIERTQDQECSALETGCRTQEKGTNTLSLIKTWNPQSHKFEPFLFTKHPRCTPTTHFNQITGFMLLHINHRFALLPAPTP